MSYKTIFKGIYYAVVVLLVAVALSLIVSVLPIPGNIKILTVLSGSMEPAIHTGSVVIIKPAVSYKIGDVITFGPNTATQVPTTHRIVEITGQNGQLVYRTKGDANNAEDFRKVLPADILGKVYFTVPFFGYVVRFARTKPGFVLLIIVPILIVIGDEVRKIVVEAVKLKKKKKEAFGAAAPADEPVKKE